MIPSISRAAKAGSFDHKVAGAALFLTVFLLSGLHNVISAEEIPADTGSPPSTAPTSAPYASVLTLDVLVPGFGSFYTGSLFRGGWIAGGRVFTAYTAARMWVEQKEYRSAARAARVADLYFGEGYRYKNPYGRSFLCLGRCGGGSYTSDEFEQIADRRAFFHSLALTLHVAILAVGWINVKSDLDDLSEKSSPIFDIGPDGTPTKSNAPTSSIDRRTGQNTVVRAGMVWRF